MFEHPAAFDEFIDEPHRGNGKTSDGEAPRFRLIPFKNLTPRNLRCYLVKNVFPRVGLILVWGPPKCGKSFWTFDAVMHIALGWEYRGRRIHQGPVVYCAFEGAEGFKARAEAFRQQHEIDGQEPPFHLVAAVMDLVQDQPALVASITAQIGDTMPVVVVVLDTLNRSLRGSESSDEDMAEYVRAAVAIQAAFQCSVIVVHHCGHDGNRPRGHSALLGAVDAQIAVSRDTSGNIIATVERMKDGPEGATIASRLEQVEVGTDEDGDAITSCIVVEAERQIPAAATNRKLSGKQHLALDCLSNLAVDGKPLPPEWNMPAGINAVVAFAWRTELERRGILDKESSNPRARWQELKTGLMTRSAISERDGMVWKT